MAKKTMAAKADKFQLYQSSVQHPDHEVAFFEQAYREEYSGNPLQLREDFCGTFAICCEWVKADKQRTAVGVDLCGETLQWGRKNNLNCLKKSQQQRVTLLEEDVRTEGSSKADVLSAQNFSFWIFKTRSEVTEYFKIAHANLKEQGVFIMDMMGGSACHVEGQTDKRKVLSGKKSFSYRWEQAKVDPITADCSYYISFKFRDGSKLNRAFEYHWRFWSIPEVREMLADAGFRDSYVYWERSEDEGGGWARRSAAPNQDCWVAYVVAVK